MVLLLCRLSFHFVSCFLCTVLIYEHFNVVPLVLFAFVACAFGVISKKSLLRLRSFFLFSSGSVMVTDHTFKSLIHFELIFIYGIR